MQQESHFHSSSCNGGKESPLYNPIIRLMASHEPDPATIC